MRQPTPQEIEALRRRWREILKSAQKKGERPSSADIQAANASNDTVVAELVAETKKAKKEHSKRLLSRVKVGSNDFQPIATNTRESAEILCERLKRPKAFR